MLLKVDIQLGDETNQSVQ